MEGEGEELLHLHNDLDLNEDKGDNMSTTSEQNDVGKLI